MSTPFSIIPPDLLYWFRQNYLDENDVIVYRAAFGLPFNLDDGFGERAAVCGDINRLEWAQNIGHTLTSKLSCIAAQYGYIDLLDWLSYKGLGDPDASCYAAKYGQIAVLDWLFDRKNLSNRIYEIAAQYGQISVLQWGLNTKRNLSYIIYIAIQYGHLHVIKWLSSFVEFGEDNCRVARNYKQQHIVDWLHQEGLCKGVHE